ncbi:Imidazolonepropionase [Dyella jiangningensis]|uniref:amidohydrolase family protein n=1 Tax=Dyella sp. AtDHG13 TaxID=1938897 RepID=UPI000885C885|nr:amidohydrolase family protein [Dyella sp. AtDHG13]PXV58559.1 imidazolonepropionase-like amidohydrolase [Dyella sp. AtDHG13]SDL15480.1 Imidazolonepropionase [Dyella jiangningensis]
MPISQTVFRTAAALALALAAPIVLSAGSEAAKTPESATLYAGATVIDGTGAEPRADQDILVRGERIVAVGPHGALSGAQGVRTVDLHGSYVIPGLIDSHVHLATPPNAKRAQAILRRNLYAGVTAVRDMADDLRSVGELAREARAGEIPSPDIYYAALMAGPEFFLDPRVSAASYGVTPGKSPWMQSIDENTDLHEAVTLARGTSATALKVYADLPPDLVAKITAEAHRQNILVWAHSAVFPTRPADVINAGVDVVSHACYLAYQLEPVMLKSYEDHTPFHDPLLAPTGDDPVIAGLYRDMLKHGTILDATGSLFVRYDAERKVHPERKPLRCTGPTTIRLVRQAWQAGVPISAGTDNDGGVDRAWPTLYDEIFFLAHDVGMPALQAIRSATLIGAQAAGQAKDMGSIEAGKLANFAVLGADPVKDIGNLRSIRMTVKRGHAYPRADYRPVTKQEMGDDDD